ncbi:hypothetical protein [Cytobacillus oceanisediminis]|uniref:Uncharacterized protein n=1 Tax=Cytobacillus oceanisediminis 2691 TaxID=1196031 RepID=A0A169FLM9_9BACI|nr:hypothetical protein [Cytobacillus oceanisediminis]AND39531.1 hypothetical protein A361_10430 [Cytobacillus oceanisediminis 2691]
MEEEKTKKVLKYREAVIAKFLNYQEEESNVFMPNEIFSDIQKPFKEIAAQKVRNRPHKFIKVETLKGIRNKRGQNEGANSTHIAFAYSYYYFITWLYRYVKYGQFKINVEDIKEILGYARTSVEVDYIIKKNGILDQINYTQTTTDYPIAWEMDDFNGLEFMLLSDAEPETRTLMYREKGRNYKVKYPVKHFHRSLETYESGEMDGLFFEPYDFDVIPFEIFLFCMGKKELGVRGFYLYCYIKRMNGFYGGGYDASYERLSEETGIPKSTLEDDMKLVRQYRMVNIVDQMDYFVHGLSKEERKATSYVANSYKLFSETKIPIKTIDRMSLVDYRAMQESKRTAPTAEEIDDQMWGLPSNL